MGKVARFALPIAALGIGAAVGPSLLGGASLPGAMTGGTTFAGASSGFSWGSLFSGAKSLFNSKGAGALSGAFGAFSNYQAGQMQRYGYELDAQRFAEERRLAGVQAQIDEADALREAYVQKTRRIAKAAAMGQDVSASRSFMAAMDREEASVQRELDAIRVNAASGRRTYGLQIGSRKAMASQASVTGGIKTGRNLFSAVKGYMDN